MIAALVLAVSALLGPANFELPPEAPVDSPAVADMPAARGPSWQEADPPAPPSTTDPGPPAFDGSYSNGRCVGAEPLLAYYSPGWSVSRMSAIMYRESRCQPGAYNRSGASGLLQVMKSHCGWLASRVGPCNLFNANYNIRAAAALWREQGYGAWSTR